MLRVSKKNLDLDSHNIIKSACNFCVGVLLPPRWQKRVNVYVKVDEEIPNPIEVSFNAEFHAYCYYKGKVENKKQFFVHLKKNTTQNMLRYLCHEFVHVKQYTLNELWDYTSGDVRFMGERYSDSIEYFDRPWEIEAFELGDVLLNEFNKMVRRNKELVKR